MERINTKRLIELIIIIFIIIFLYKTNTLANKIEKNMYYQKTINYKIYKKIYIK